MKKLLNVVFAGIDGDVELSIIEGFVGSEYDLNIKKINDSSSLRKELLKNQIDFVILCKNCDYFEDSEVLSIRNEICSTPIILVGYSNNYLEIGKYYHNGYDLYINLDDINNIGRLLNEYLSFTIDNFGNPNKKIDNKHNEIIFNESTDAILILEDKYIRKVNNSTCLLLNRNSNDLIGKKITEFLPKYKTSQLISENDLIALLKKSNSKKHEFKIKIIDSKNKEKNCEAILSPIAYMGIPCSMLLLRDISHLESLIEKCDIFENTLNTIFENPSQAICVIQDDLIKHSNKNFSKIFDNFKENQSIWNIFKNIHEDDRRRVIENYNDRLSGKRTPNSYNVRYNKGSDTMEAELNIRQIIWNDRPALLVFIIDMTYEKNLEYQLLQAAKMESIGQLAGGIAHDFNNVLTAILGHTTLLKMELPSKSQNYMAAHTIEKAAKGAAELTQQLLDFARINEETSTCVNINSTIEELVKILEHTIDRKIHVHIYTEAKSSIIKGNPAQLKQVILNLALNARDAMPNGGTLNIYTTNIESITLNFEETSQTYIQIIIEDSGTGIPEEVKDKIFEPFFTTKEKGKGTGMGLAMVKSIIEKHDGLIEFISSSEQGTKFVITIPCFESVDEIKLSNDSRLVFGQDKIIIVDDDEIVLRLSIELLEKLGYTVYGFDNSHEAIKFFEKNSDIRLAIIDMILPDMSGLDCFRIMKRINPSLMTILCTGHGITDQVEEVTKSGHMIFLQKPFQLTTLSSYVSNAIQIQKTIQPEQRNT